MLTREPSILLLQSDELAATSSTQMVFVWTGTQPPDRNIVLNRTYLVQCSQDGKVEADIVALTASLSDSAHFTGDATDLMKLFLKVGP